MIGEFDRWQNRNEYLEVAHGKSLEFSDFFTLPHPATCARQYCSRRVSIIQVSSSNGILAVFNGRSSLFDVLLGFIKRLVLI